MLRLKSVCSAACFVMVCIFPASLTLAGVSATGDVDPADPTTWTEDITAFVGKTGNGTLNVTEGDGVNSKYGYVGYDTGSEGEVTVDGDDSAWTNNNDLNVGYSGDGTLNIADGGAVSNYSGYLGYNSGSEGVVAVDGTDSTWTNNGALFVGYNGRGTLNLLNGGSASVSSITFVAYDADSIGVVNFGNQNGTLSTTSIYFSPDQLRGTGTINTKGVVTDADIVLDGSGSSFTLGFASYDSGLVTMNLDLSDTVGRLGVGYKANGSMTIQNGTKVKSSLGDIGVHSNSTGVVTVDGAGSTWTNSLHLYVGLSGNGTLNITNGGMVINKSDSGENGYAGYVGYNPDSKGVVTVDGADSALVNYDYSLRIGYYGDGTLNIINGGTVRSNNYANYGNDIGYYYGSKGVVTVDGTGSTWIGGAITNVGLFGDGTLNITDGGVVSGGAGTRLGYESGSTGEMTVDGAGSTWDSGGLTIGGCGAGTLYITNGGTVNSSSSFIGDDTGSMGVATVDGVDSIWTNSGLDVGRSGDGTLNILNGGVVNNDDDDSCIGYDAGSTGVVRVDGTGSTWTQIRRFYVGNRGTGTLNITNGGTVSSNDYAYLGYFSGSRGVVTVDGTGSTWTNGYKLYVGDSGVGTLNIFGGGLVTIDETLTIDYDGNGKSFINMSTGGMLALYGEADDSIFQFLELVEGSDAIRYWDDSVGDWALITGAAPGEDYTLSYSDTGNMAGYTVLTVTAAPEPATLSLLMFAGAALLRRRR